MQRVRTRIFPVVRIGIVDIFDQDERMKTKTGKSTNSQNNNKNKPRHIVSSDHLATESGWQLSELEYAMTMAYNAFTRWMVHCMTAAGHKDLNPLDILVLHNINHRTREKRLSDIVFVMNVEDTHTINYSIKKLVKAELVEGNKQGKEMFYSTTDEGRKLCIEYRNIREECLVSAAASTDRDFDEISRMARVLRSMSGLYDQASRAAASF